MSPAIWDHTVLPATWHRWSWWTCSTITPDRQASTLFTYPRGIKGQVELDGWLHTKTKKQSEPTSAKAMLFTRWQHHLRFCSSFSYAPLKAMVTKISKWSRIQDSFRITPKIELLVVCAIPDIPSKFQKDPAITFWVILLTQRQTDRQTDKQTNKVWQKHYLLGGGK